MVESVAAMERSPRLSPVSAQIPHKPATSGRANSARPFRGDRATQGDAGQQSVGGTAETIDPAPSGGRSGRLHPLAVEHQEEHRRGDERREEDVEHRHPALDDVEAIERQQERREAGPPHRAPEVEREEVEQRHTHDAEHRRGQAPSDRALPDRADPEEGDDPLAERWVYPRRLVGDPHGRRLADRVHDPAPEVGGRVEHVIRLVSEGLTGRAETPQAEPRSDREHQHGNGDATRGAGEQHGSA